VDKQPGIKKAPLASAIKMALASSSVLALAFPFSAQAQQQPALEEILVTAAAGGGRSQIESSVAVTAVNTDAIQDFQPSSESEVLRMIPGIQVSGTSGPGGNANIAVRGLPVATGGSPFVQIQEDGLPTVLFGDIQFGNNDYWTRFDASVDKVEGIRGGTAGTYTSQAPGAIINYISNYGQEEGGYIQANTGLGFDESRIDFRYGGPASDSVNYHIGGFVRQGEGPLEIPYGASDSVQIKGNITKYFDDNQGYIRFLGKFADTQEANYTGSPFLGSVNGDKVSNIKAFPGFDGRDQSNYSILNNQNQIVNREGDLETVPMNGIATKTTAIGNELQYVFTDNLRAENKMRWTEQSGTFYSPFQNVVRADSVTGSMVNGATVGEIRYANGPNAGQLYDREYLDNGPNVHTNMRDVGSFVNDLTLIGEYWLGDGDLTVRAGYFHMKQDIAMDWHINRAYTEVSGDNPAMLDLYDDEGNLLTARGIAGFNDNWGDCCSRDYDLSYTNTAPYVVLDWENDLFIFDVSTRFENVKSSGWTVAGLVTGDTPVQTTDFNGDQVTVMIPTMEAQGARENLDYDTSYESWTVGGLWKASRDTSLFVRASEGGRFNGDRQTVSGKINADGSLNESGRVADVDFVNQYEVGIKNRGELFDGLYSIELTLLKGDFKQSTFELSQTVCRDLGFGDVGGCIIDAEYKSQGFELLGTYFWDRLSVTANATFTDAEQLGVGDESFRRASGIPDLTYTIYSSYELTDQFSVGLNVTGQTDTLDAGQREWPGSATWGANAKYSPTENLELGLQVYNLLDELDLRGAGGVNDTSVTPAVLSGNAALGRTARASIKVLF